MGDSDGEVDFLGSSARVFAVVASSADSRLALQQQQPQQSAKGIKAIKHLSKARAAKARKARLSITATLAHQLCNYVQCLKVSRFARSDVQLHILKRRSKGAVATGSLQLVTKHLKVLTKESRHRSLGFTHSVDLNIAYTSIFRCADVAKSASCDPNTVRRCRQRVAFAYLDHEVRLLDELLEACLADAPASVTHGIKFDEAKQRISVPISSQLSGPQSSMGWHTMISRRFVQASWSCGRSVWLEILCPPEACIDTSASTCWEALHSPCMEQIRDRVARIVATARFAFEIRATDGASSNMKLLAYEFRHFEVENINQLPMHFLCLNHQNHLISVSLSGIFGTGLTHDMYATCNLLRSGSYFIRLIAAAHSVLSSETLQVIPGVAPHATLEATAQLKQYVLLHWSDHCSRDEHSQNRKQCKWQGDVDEFFCLFNGIGSSEGGGVVHYCNGCCQSKAHTVSRMTASARKVILRRKPVLPEAGKWTKRGMTLDWFLLAFLSGMCAPLLQAACNPLRGQVQGHRTI